MTGYTRGKKKTEKRYPQKADAYLGSSETRIRRADFILIGTLAAISLLLLIVPAVLYVSPRSPALLIRVDGEEYGTYPLSADRTIEINDTNVCQIKNGEVTMVSATCPDKICMQESSIGRKGGTIVCLPNKIVLSIVNADEPEGGELDGVAR